MAIQNMQLDPTAVPQATHDAHTHNYQGVTELGVDASKNYNTPARVATQADAEVNVADATDLEAVGLTLGGMATTTPN